MDVLVSVRSRTSRVFSVRSVDCLPFSSTVCLTSLTIVLFLYSEVGFLPSQWLPSHPTVLLVWNPPTYTVETSPTCSVLPLFDPIFRRWSLEVHTPLNVTSYLYRERFVSWTETVQGPFSGDSGILQDGLLSETKPPRNPVCLSDPIGTPITDSRTRRDLIRPVQIHQLRVIFESCGSESTSADQPLWDTYNSM